MSVSEKNKRVIESNKVVKVEINRYVKKNEHCEKKCTLKKNEH